jgi:sensor c-di-GMP phosphodiesterase-like protein
MYATTLIVPVGLIVSAFVITPIAALVRRRPSPEQRQFQRAMRRHHRHMR